MPVLPSILHAESKRYSLVILQSSLAQSCLPVLRSLLGESASKSVVFCLLYSPSTLVDTPSDSVVVHNWVGRVSRYQEADTHAELLALTEEVLQGSSQSTTVVLDSLDTLLSDAGTLTEAYKCLSDLYALVKKHGNARLILHSQSPSPLIPLITTTSFSSSLLHLIAHPPTLLQHLSSDLFVPPPPDAKFWDVFIPISQRIHSTERLVFGPAGEGTGHPSEIVIELIVREATRRKKGVERILEGWSNAPGKKSCELSVLESLKDLMIKQKEPAAAPDPTQNLPFNLNLTSSQQESRAQVPLPYVHTDKAIDSSTPGAIYYDPDSADDIDDEDPDEDLDI